MNKNFTLFVRILFIFVDLLMLNASFFVFKVYKFGALPAADHRNYAFVWILSNVVWLICCQVYTLYKCKFAYKTKKFARKTIYTYALFSVSILGYTYVVPHLSVPIILAGTVLAGFSFFLIINRILYRLTWTYLKNKNYWVKRVMIIGYNEVGKQLASYFERNDTQTQVVGFCEEQHKINELSNYPIISTPVNAVQASQNLRITDIYSTILPEQDYRIYDLMNLADEACIRFKLVPDLSLFVNRPMHMNYLPGLPVLSLRTEPLDDLVSRVKKRFIDIIFSGLAIVFVLSWLVPLVALAIWLDSRGPIFFIQRRTGVNNKPFDCLKFRSMHVNGEAHTKQACKNDDRLTRVGKFIRKTNLDEFPQFLNVIKGEMSIVGPRPHMIKHTQEYSRTINKYMVRQFLKPGITGWAQIHGHRGEIQTSEDMQVRVNHDLWYLENWNLLLDFRIMLVTAYNILRGEKNAY